MNEDWLKFYAGLAMMGLLMRSKGTVFPDEIVEDSLAIAKLLLASSAKADNT